MPAAEAAFDASDVADGARSARARLEMYDRALRRGGLPGLDAGSKASALTLAALYFGGHGAASATLTDILEPVVAKTTEQIDVWRSLMPEAVAPPAADGNVGRPPAPGPKRRRRRSSRLPSAAAILRVAAVFGIVSMLLGGVLYSGRLDLPSLPVWSVRPLVALCVSLGAVGVLVLVAAGVTLWRRYRPPAKTTLLVSEDYFQRFEKHRARHFAETMIRLTPTLRKLSMERSDTGRRRLAVQPTVRASVENQGAFTGVYRPQLASPSFVFVVAMGAQNGPLPMEAERMTHAFLRSGLPTEVFCWEPRSGIVSPNTATAESQAIVTMTEVWLRHPHSTLIMIADSADLVDPMSLRPRSSLRILENWPARVLLSPQAPAPGFEAEVVKELGLTTGPLSVEGMAGVADILHAPRSMTARRQSDAANWGGWPPASLWDEALSRWEAGDQGDGAWWLLEHALTSWLGRPGLHWVATASALPVQRWETAIAIGRCLNTAQDEPAYSEARACRIGALLWFRQGRIPLSIRLRLRRSLNRAERCESQKVLKELLGDGGIGAAGVFGLAEHADPEGLMVADGLTTAFMAQRRDPRELPAALLAALVTSIATLFKPAPKPARPGRPPKGIPDLDHGGPLLSRWWFRALAALGMRPNRLIELDILRGGQPIIPGPGFFPGVKNAMEAAVAALAERDSTASPRLDMALLALKRLEPLVLRREEGGGREIEEYTEGVMLCGGSAEERSALLNAFLYSANVTAKYRFNATTFLSGVNSMLYERQRRQSGAYLVVRLEMIAKRLAQEIRLLAIEDIKPLDRLQAVVFRRILDGLIRNNVRIVASSDYLPEELASPGARGEHLNTFLRARMNPVRIMTAEAYRSQVNALRRPPRASPRSDPQPVVSAAESLERTVEAYRKAILQELELDARPRHLAQWRAKLGEILNELGRIDEAIDTYRAAWKDAGQGKSLPSERQEIFRALTSLLMDEERYDEARELLMQAIEEDGRFVERQDELIENLNRLASLLYSSGRTTEAKNWLGFIADLARRADPASQPPDSSGTPESS